MSHETHWKFIENLCLSISKYYLCYCITYLDFISTYTSIVEILYKISRLLGTKMDFHTHKYLFFMPNHLRHFQLIWRILCFVANVLLKFLPTDVPLRFAPTNVLPTTYQRFKKKWGKKSMLQYNMSEFEFFWRIHPKFPPTDVLPIFLPADVLHRASWHIFKNMW